MMLTISEIALGVFESPFVESTLITIMSRSTGLKHFHLTLSCKLIRGCIDKFFTVELLDPQSFTIFVRRQNMILGIIARMASLSKPSFN